MNFMRNILSPHDAGALHCLSVTKSWTFTFFFSWIWLMIMVPEVRRRYTGVQCILTAVFLVKTYSASYLHCCANFFRMFSWFWQKNPSLFWWEGEKTFCRWHRRQFLEKGQEVYSENNMTGWMRLLFVNIFSDRRDFVPFRYYCHDLCLFKTAFPFSFLLSSQWVIPPHFHGLLPTAKHH